MSNKHNVMTKKQYTFLETEQKILEILLVSPYKELTIREIAKKINIDYSFVYRLVKKLIKRKLIITKKQAKSTFCRINLQSNPERLAIVSITHAIKFLNKQKFAHIIDEIKEKLFDCLYIMVLYGSYAKGTQTKTSDIDLLFVVQEKNAIPALEKEINNILSLSPSRIHFQVTITEWLLKGFSERNTMSRSVLNNSIVLHGAEHYYYLVKKHDETRGH